MPAFSLENLFSFISQATAHTYAGAGKYLETPERKDHYELEYSNDDWYYKDSYCGFYKSRGSEYVMFQNKVVWETGYGGGMVKGKESMSKDCFEFLKVSLKIDEEGFLSFRGPRYFQNEGWEYKYTQEGDMQNFIGHEEISLNGELMFYHDIIGGVVIDQ
jgi:hypothetical protein